ncbi:MAG TPA: SCO family protein [Candidatus Angelobacter sp.]
MIRSLKIRGLVASLILLVGASTCAWTQAAPKEELGQSPPNQKPSILDHVGIDQHLNLQIPLDLNFVDEHGQAVLLRQYFAQKPVIMTMVYFQCPMLCSQVLSGLTFAFNGMSSFNVGREFNVVTVSFDPRDKPQDAQENKDRYIKRYRRAGSDQGWHFLTGKKEQIDALAQALGFRYAWDPENQQFAHASGLMLLTPDGRIAQYYYGIEYAPRDLRLGIVEASKGKVGTIVDTLLLYCYHYDPRQGKYGVAIFNVLRISAAATLLLLGALVFFLLRRERRSRPDQTAYSRRAEIDAI